MNGSEPLTVMIRPMCEDDIEEVLVIERLSFALPWSENSYRHELRDNPDAFIWVAELHTDDDEKWIAGVIVVWLILDEMHVATIGVHPDYGGRHIARRLLARALAVMRQKGAVQATLEVRKSNLPAQALYRSFGFEVVGERPKYYCDNDEDALIMTVSDLNGDSIKRLNVNEV
jgi:ribosomal-protein-alanine N-acetyltransferase